jgi:hypothetical protein
MRPTIGVVVVLLGCGGGTSDERIVLSGPGSGKADGLGYLGVLLQLREFKAPTLVPGQMASASFQPEADGFTQPGDASVAAQMRWITSDGRWYLEGGTMTWPQRGDAVLMVEYAGFDQDEAQAVVPPRARVFQISANWYPDDCDYWFMGIRELTQKPGCNEGDGCVLWGLEHYLYPRQRL